SFENRLQVTIANLASSRENLSAANSRIRDVDVAEETAAMTRNNILMQAGVSVLAQANQLPALALQLLQS
ncbi:MAG: flagellin, partial [Deltaproteobacteria bacterium]|nr:flagellin [Deltaproteobacteria bacterium]